LGDAEDMPRKDVDRGRRAYDRRAWKDAHALLSQADRGNALRAADLERLATSALLIGREREFERTLERAHRAYRDAGDRPSAARCTFWIGFLLFLRGETGPATGWFARGQRLLEQEGRETVEEGYLRLPVAEQHLRAGESERARTVAREATGIGTRLGDRDLIAAARHIEGKALLEMGRVEEGFVLLDEAMVEVTSGELSPMMTGLIYCSVIGCCHRVHELGRAREWTAALTRWCEGQRQMMVFTSTCLVHRSEILQLQGAWAAALAEARRASAQHAEGIDEFPSGPALYQQGEILRLRGELDAAERAYRSASRAGAEPHPGLGLLWLARGRTRAAAAAIGRALDETVEPLARARLLPARVEILLAGRDHAGARIACDELAEIAVRFHTDVLRATAAQVQGALELAAGNPRAALVQLRLAWHEWQALEFPHAAARTREALGLACRALGDRAGGRMELEAARAAYETLGAVPDVARIDALLAHRPAVGLHGLTAREVEVLRLVAAGKSNKGVADALSLSVKTVERHVGNILTKLDLPSRVAATAWAYENEVVRRAG
jgi:DNA-binding CsgD family transcriptional regulator/tetratricopeptide (TPR) repeat protein